MKLILKIKDTPSANLYFLSLKTRIRKQFLPYSFTNSVTNKGLTLVHPVVIRVGPPARRPRGQPEKFLAPPRIFKLRRTGGSTFIDLNLE